jgi:hypothetical protein
VREQVGVGQVGNEGIDLETGHVLVDLKRGQQGGAQLVATVLRTQQLEISGTLEVGDGHLATDLPARQTVVTQAHGTRLRRCQACGLPPSASIQSDTDGDFRRLWVSTFGVENCFEVIIRDSNVSDPMFDITRVSYVRRCVHDSGGVVSSDVGLGNSAASVAGTSAAGTKRGHGPTTSAADIVVRTCLDPFLGWMVTAAGRVEGDSPEVRGVPVVDDFDCVAEYMTSCRYSAVSVASKSGRSGHRLHRLVWNLEGTWVELVADPPDSLASGVG